MAPSLIGQRLGPYEIQSLLGSGGMGEVYRARDTKLGREVAIKILPEAFLTDPDRLARFEREARVLASLNHPHIGAIYGFEEREGIRALVLELVLGETLADRIKDGPLPVPRVLLIARQIADALEAAHDKGIVHRDLKPANVILQAPGLESAASAAPSAGGSASAGVVPALSGSRRPLPQDLVAKVIDFGLAKGTDAASQDLTHVPTRSGGATSTGMIFGTAGYMSPEQTRGADVDRRSDVWAFGCIVYEMMTGRRAFAAETLSDTLVAVLERQPDWSALPNSTPPAVRRMLRRCLEKDVRRRLREIADARIDIEDAFREPSGSRLFGAVSYKRPRAFTLGAALIAIAAIGAALTLWRSDAPAPVGRGVARLMLTLPPGQALVESRTPAVALSPDGRILAYVATDGGRPHLYLRPLDEFVAREVPETENATAPFFSPDGQWLAFHSSSVLKKVSISGGVPLTIGDVPPIWSARWRPDDTIVFATTLPSSGLWMIPANGGEAVQLTTPGAGEAQHAYPQPLPLSDDVLFSIRRNEGWQLGRLSLTTREWRALGGGRLVGEGAQYLPTQHVVYAESGGLVATRFDPAVGVLDQPAFPLVERLERPVFGGVSFAVAEHAGTLVYRPGGATLPDRTLTRIGRDGRASPILEPRDAYAHPALSHDGRWMAVTIASDAGSDIWLIDLQRSTRIRFTSGDASAFPVWSPDDSRIAFQSAGPGPWTLFSKSVDGRAGVEPILTNVPDSSWPNAGAALLPGTMPALSGAGPQVPSSWAPDGRTLAFEERKASGEHDIWVVSPGGDPQGFLLTPFDERQPRFSPDGKWLAYVSDEGGRDDVYVQPFPGPGAKWLISTDGGFDPVWSRDGRELFYRRGSQLVRVDVTAAPEFSSGRPQLVFDGSFPATDLGPSYDVAPAGTWFVLPRGTAVAAPAELHVVLDWFDEVAARAGGRSVSARPLAAEPTPGGSAVIRTSLARVLQRLRGALMPHALAQTRQTIEDELRATMARYSRALESLDADAVKAVQPSIAVETLTKAFRDMRELSVEIDAVKVLSLDQSTARVSCRVMQTLTPRAGARQATTVTRVVRLRRTGETWVIDAFER